MIHLRKSKDRGHAHHGWLDSRHSFSFADYHDVHHMNFRSLRVINEDRVAPKMGFGMHPHRDMEIITYVVQGTLRHRDSMGNTTVMHAGDIQRISAGKGVQHSEFNDSAEEPVRFLQIWITPEIKGAPPAYAEKSFASAQPGQLHLLTSPTGREGSLPINQNADLYLAKLTPGGSVIHRLASDRHAWLQLIDGTLEMNGKHLANGDAAAISEADTLTFSTETSAHFLLFDLN